MVRGKPVSGYLAIQVSVPDGGAFQLRPDGLDAAVRCVVLHGRVDEAAALAGSGHPVNGLDSGFRQNDVNAFAHGKYGLASYIHSICTPSVYVKIYQYVACHWAWMSHAVATAGVVLRKGRFELIPSY